MLNIWELCLKIMLYNRKFIHLQCVFHSIRLRLRLTKIGCRETINFFFLPIRYFILFDSPFILQLLKTPNYFLTPPSLRATSTIFCITKHPVRLRDTAGREYDTRLLLLLFFNLSVVSTPSPCGHSPYIP